MTATPLASFTLYLVKSWCLCCPACHCSGRDERTFMKMIVHVPTNRVVGCHMVSWLAAGWQRHIVAHAQLS